MSICHSDRGIVAKLLALIPFAMAVSLLTTGAHAVTQAAGPGVAGQVHAAAYDPLDPNTVYVGSDCAGISVTHDHGQSWAPFNRGLGNDELAASNYVDDLLVVRGVPGGNGVYAATRGGIYFNSGTSDWQLQTPYAHGFRYRGGYAAQQIGGTPVGDLFIPMPFSTLAFDQTTGWLYAGAGTARMVEGSDIALDIYYPDGGNLTSNPTWSPKGLYSLWRCNVASGSSTWEAVTAAGNVGQVRQIAVVTKDGYSKIAFATRQGVFVWTPGETTVTNVWMANEKDFESGNAGLWAVSAWGVGGGFGGTLYVAKAAIQAAGVTSYPGVFSLAVFAPPLSKWKAVGNPALPVFLQDSTTQRTRMTWHDVITAVDSDHSSNLLGLTVVPGDALGNDEIFIGERTFTQNTGYFRYGEYAYFDSTLQGIAHRQGWLYALYVDTNLGTEVIADHFVYRAVNCYGGPDVLPTDAEIGPGWFSNCAVFATVPLIVHPQSERRMMAFAYHIPVAFDALQGLSAPRWEQRYCIGSGTADNGSWASRGLNMGGVQALAFTGPPARLVVADEDFNGFMSTGASQGQFKWLDWYSDGSNKDGRDIAILKHQGSEKVLLLRDRPNKYDFTTSSWLDFGFGDGTQQRVVAEYDPTPSETLDAHKNGYHWKYLSRGLNGVFGDSVKFVVEDIEVTGADTLFAACVFAPEVAPWVNSSKIFRGIYNGTDVNWELWCDFAALPAPQGPLHLRAVEMRRVPGTNRLLVAAADGNAGVYCLNVLNKGFMQTWMSKGGAGMTPYRDQTLEHITTIECDRMGQVVYLGSRGEVYDLDAYYYGAVWQLAIPDLALGEPDSGDWHLIANDVEQNTFDFALPSTPGFWIWPNESAYPSHRLTGIQDIEIDPWNPYKVYVGLFVPGLRKQGTFHPTNGVWSTVAGPHGTTAPEWTRVFPADATLEPSRGVNCMAINPDDLGEMFVGTEGQEMYRFHFEQPVHPAIAAGADGPIWSTGQLTPTTIAVGITHPGNLSMSTVELYPNTLSVAGAKLVMYDGGPDVGSGTDLVAGDHIYTSESFETNVAAGTYEVRVFAQATDGSYNEAMVTVEAVSYAAKFTNVSDVSGTPLGLSYAGTPYSAIALDYDGNVDKDLLLTQGSSGIALVFGGQSPAPGGIPQFSYQHDHSVAGARGAASADFDNDGKMDYFIAGATSMLWRNMASSGPRPVGDVAAALGLTAVDGATAACWGDYDRDGWLDLFVVRNTAMEPGGPGFTFQAGDHRLYRNCIGEGGGFVDVTAAAGLGAATLPNSTSASWVDVDQDGDLDLFVAMAPVVFDGGPPSGNVSQPLATPSHLFINQDNGTLVEDSSMRFASPLTDITGAVWADVNADGAMDLLVSLATGGAYVHLNDGTGHFPNQASQLTHDSLGYTGICVTDQDLDGWPDILLAPSGNNRPVQLLLNKEWAGERSFAPGGLASGLSGQVPVSGLLAADFTRDGDAELFAGMPFAVKNFFYKTDSQAGAASLSKPYVKIRLNSQVSTINRDGIGARVTVVAGTSRQTQVVDGGSGRGEQKDRELIFGLPEGVSGILIADITWPGGGHQPWPVTVSSGTGAEVVNVIAPYYNLSSPQNVTCVSTVNPATATLNWTFSWDTDVATDWMFDQVLLSANTGTFCWPGVTSYVASSPAVQHTYAAKPGGGYRHSITIPNVECLANCTFKYQVASSLTGQSAQGCPLRTKKVLVCPSQF